MKKGIAAAILVAMVLLVAVFASISTYNSLVRQEEGIKATYEDMKNVHASIFNQIRGQGLTVEKYGEMVIEAIEKAMSGRYGASGSGAAFQWIQEENPTIDPLIFAKLQTVIEAGYKEFESKQRAKIDRMRIYKEGLRVFPRGAIASMLGFPKIDMSELDVTITTSDTKKTFETKDMETIDPFKE